MAPSPKENIDALNAELRRRSISRWAMIVRKMKHLEPSTDLSNILQNILNNVCNHCWGASRLNKDYKISYLSFGILPILQKLLRSEYSSEIIWAIKIIGALSLNNKEFEKSDLFESIVFDVIQILYSNKIQEIRNVINTLKDMTVSESLLMKVSSIMVDTGAIQKLIHITLNGYVYVSTSCMVIKNISYSGKRCCDVIVKEIIPYLSSNNYYFKIMLVPDIICNILSGYNPILRCSFIEFGTVPLLENLINWNVRSDFTENYFPKKALEMIITETI
jgi:hypothetical protein